MKKRVLIWLFILTNIGISEEIINSKNEKENNKIVVEEAVIKQNENEDKKYYEMIDGKIYYKEYWDTPVLVKEIDVKTFAELEYSYAKDKNNYYYKNKKILVDKNSFVIENYFIAKDKNNIYVLGRKIPGFASEKLRIYEGDTRYITDGTDVYFIDTKLMNSDPSTFVILDNETAKDKNNVYKYGEILYGADSETFEILGNIYSKDKNKVYSISYPMDKADAKSFKSIGDWYGKDKNFVFYRDDIVENADSKTFKHLEYKYGIDKNYVYYSNKRIEDADPQSFVLLNKYVSKDKNYVYYLTSKVLNFKPEDLKDGNIDTDKFVIQEKESEYNMAILIDEYEKREKKRLEDLSDMGITEMGFDYYMYKNLVYYNDKFSRKIFLYKADIETLEAVEDSYNEILKDKNRVYIAGRMLEGADPVSFEVITGRYYKDKKNVYIGWNKINNADIKTFEVIDGNYSWDKSRVYFNETEIPDIDKESFKTIGNSYSKDKNHIYYEKKIIKNADIESFVLILPENLHGEYAKDKNRVYYLGRELEGVDPESFQHVNSIIRKDKKNVYYNEKIIEGADPETFQEIEGASFYKDKNRAYYGVYGVQTMDVDIKTFKILNFYYSKDKKNVYYEDKKLETLDPKTFEVIDYSYGKDKNGVYYIDYPLDLDINHIKTEADIITDGKKTYYDNKELKGINQQEWENLGGGYSKDRDSIYYTGEKIINSDAGSAETIQESLKEECTLNYGWSDHIRDKNYVYYRGKIVEGADPETFKCISYNVYSDKNNIYLKNTILKNVKENEIIFFDKWDKGYYIRGNDIYYEAIKLDGININDFQYINPERSFSYIKSTKNVYLYGKKIIGADPKTFKISFEGYLISQDKNHVYYNGEKIPGIIPNSFKVDHGYLSDGKIAYYNGEKMDKNINIENIQYLGGSYVTDGINVFYDGKWLESFNEGEFLVLSYDYAKGKKEIYYDGEKIDGADYDSFQELEKEYAKDSKNVYLKGKVMQADVKTFRVLSYNFSRDDKNWYGENGERILK